MSFVSYEIPETIEEQTERYKAARDRMYAAAENPKIKPKQQWVNVLPRNLALRRKLAEETQARFVESIKLALARFKPNPRGGESWPQAVERIKREVCAGREWQGRPMTPKDLESQCRDQVITRARQYAMYRCKTELRLSYPTIGQKFGGRDHTTVLHACRKVEAARRELAK